MRLRRPACLLAAPLALAAAGAAVAATPPKGKHFTGKTKQARTISFDVSSTGKRIVHPIFYLKTHCFGGGNSFAQTSARSTAKASGAIKQGKFKLNFSENARLHGGVKAKATFALTGHFTSHNKKAVGSVGVTVRYSNGVECLSGKVGYSVAG